MSETSTAAAGSMNPSQDDFAAMLEESFETYGAPAEGSVLKGKIIDIQNDMAIVDVGLKTDGR